MDRIYPTELQLNRANSSDTEAHFLDLDLCISYGAVSTKTYDKQNDFDFDVVNFPFLDGDVPRRTSYAVHISQIIRFARASSILVVPKHMNGFLLTRDLLSIPILSILLLSLQWVLKKIKTDFLRYSGYRNFINDLIKHVSLLILVHVRLLFRPSC